MIKRLSIFILLLFVLVVKAEAAALVFVEDNSFLENGYKYVQGIVKNEGTDTLKIITITVKFYNQTKEFLKFAQCFVKPAYLLPGHEGFYSVSVRNDPGIKGYSLHADYNLE